MDKGNIDLPFKIEVFSLSEAGICWLNPKLNWDDFRYCNHRCHLMIMALRKVDSWIFSIYIKLIETESEMSDLICYCFEYTKEDIEKDFLINGRSLILEKISYEKKLGNCQCSVKNPKGR